MGEELTNEAIESSATTAKRSREESKDDHTEAEVLQKKSRLIISNDIPLSEHYHVSWMHAAVVTSAVTSLKHGYVITASADGIVKFWKRLQVDGPDAASADQGPPCLEFVKSFTAHAGSVLSLAMDEEESGGDMCCSVGADGLLKFYEVSTFDALTMIVTGKQLGAASCWLREPTSSVKIFCVSAADSGSLYLYAVEALTLLQTLTLHGGNCVTCLLSLPQKNCVLSTDSKGIIELWSTFNVSTSAGKEIEQEENTATTDGTTTSSIEHLRVGGPCTSRNGVDFSSKMDTDLYALLRKKTHCLAATATPLGSHFALYSADHKIRIFDFKTGKVVVTFDERLDKVYDRAFSTFGLDSIEYGRRAALEREMIQESTVFSAGLPSQAKSSLASIVPQRLSIQFDLSGRYLLVPTLVGIKVIDWLRHKLVKVIGKADASQLRFCSICLAPGDAKVNRQMQLARKASTKTSADAEANGSADGVNDALLIALAYNKRRVFVFSHIDPLADPDAPEDAHNRRDIWNEAPTVDEKVHTGAHTLIEQSAKLAKKAILRTTKGDIHIQLFVSQVPKTIENFVGHAKSGYYDNVIFHRVIKGSCCKLAILWGMVQEERASGEENLKMNLSQG